VADFDEKGDIMDLQVTFKMTSNNTLRPIDIMILESFRANRISSSSSFFEMRNYSIYFKEEVGKRLETSIENTKNGKMSIVFHNELQDGDNDNWDNATVNIRVDYQVFNVEENESNVLLIIILILLIIVTLAMLVGIGFFFLKRRMKDSRTFFSPDGGVYYVFRDIDGSIMYFNAGQYTDMYNSHGLVTYEYLGQAMKKGGPVMTPIEEGVPSGQDASLMQTQPMTPVPIVGSEALPHPAGISQIEQFPTDAVQLESVPIQGDLYAQTGQPLETAPMEGPQFPDGPEEDVQTGYSPEDNGGQPGDVLDELVSHAHTSTDEDPDEPLANIGGEGEGNVDEEE
jgi:hypothetical protein